MNWAPIGFGFPCGKSKPVSEGGGPVVLKQYCSFAVEAGDKFVANFSTGTGCATDIQAIDATMKFTLIEVLEPE